MKNFLADIMMKSENPDLFEYILYKKLHGTKSTVKKEEGVPPLTFTSSGFPLNSYEIFGNFVNGDGVGERTENLYNSSETDWELGILDDNGNPTGSTTSHYTRNFTAVEPGAAYYLSGTIYIGQSGHRIYYYDENKTWISRSSLIEYFYGNFTTPANCRYVRVQVTADLVSTSDWMLNTGSTALPYEPYGYKIPVSCGGETTTIYIGENPLRKALDDSVFDELASEGIIIRRVDDEGTPLVEPITETVICPVIDTDEGSNTFDVDTTVTPSKVILYHT